MNMAPGTGPNEIRVIPADWLHPVPVDRIFPVRQPLHVDLGCGKGRFLLASAAAHPDVNYLGIERMLRRVRKVEGKIRRQGLQNARLLRMEARYAMTYLVPASSVSVCYVFFPDPWPKKRHQDHRLFGDEFLAALDRTLTGDGVVHIATDHRSYYEDCVSLFHGDRRFEGTTPFRPESEFQTDFERYYIQHQDIGRCSYRKRQSVDQG